MESSLSRLVLGFIGPATVSFAVSSAALASTPASETVADRASATACIMASGLADAQVGAVARFSDRTAMDARTVTGRGQQAHMQGMQTTMLCLYNRRTRRVESVEMAVASTMPVKTDIREIWWRAEDIGGRGLIDRSEITLFLGQGGKVGGRSGCNNYSARYQIEGERLRVFPPIIGTRMACAPAVMEQERRYQALLERTAQFEFDTSGALVLITAGLDRLRFMPATGGTFETASRSWRLDCGGMIYRAAFSPSQADVDMPDGRRRTLPRLEAAADPEATRIYEGTGLRFEQSIEGRNRGVVLIRGDRTPVRCRQVPE